MYTVDDFLQNIRFVEWVENPRPEDDLYWKQWLEEHPQAAKSMERAIEWIRSWSSDNKFLPETYYTNLKNRIDQTIQAQEASRFQWPFRAFFENRCGTRWIDPFSLFLLYKREKAGTGYFQYRLRRDPDRTPA